MQRYELGPLLGQGGSAQVHRAWDRLLDRAVAVKLFASGVAGPDRYRQDHELAMLTRLVHPGLVELYDAGADQGRAYLVMRLAQGPSLADRLRDVALPVTTVAELGAQVADTLAYVHAHGVTHRDIKPANVLLDEHDHPLLADFGIALFVDTTRVTLTGAVIGTAAYMAPEQARGEPVGPAADVYSLGLVLLEALTRRREYPGTSVESACARLHRAPTVPDNLPASLTQTLRRMTAIEPAERPSSAAAASALQAAAAELHGGPTAVDTDLLTELLDKPTPPVGPPGRWRRRIVLAGAAFGFTLATGLLGLTALDQAIGGRTGIVSPPPATATPLWAPPTNPSLSTAPPAAPAPPPQTASPPPSTAPPAAPAPPLQTTSPPRFTAPPAAPAPPPQTASPPPSAAPPAAPAAPAPQTTSPPPAVGVSAAAPATVATRKPVSETSSTAPTQAVPPTTTAHLPRSSARHPRPLPRGSVMPTKSALVPSAGPMTKDSLPS
jgi:serine/threonine protein kinase